MSASETGFAGFAGKHRLLLHITLILLLKMALLFGIWKVWVKPYKVHVDSANMAQQLTVKPTSVQEKKHD
jgi:hypothetical protein